MNAAPKKKPKVVQILLVDDHPIVRRGLRQVIDQQPDLQVCCEAEDFDQALACVVKCHPEVAVVDLSLKGRDGLELIRCLKTKHPQLRSLVLSMHDEAIYAERSLRAGAYGYIMKHEALDRVLHAIRRVMAGGLFLSDEIQAHWVGAAGTGGANILAQSIQSLTRRELEVFDWIGQGLRTKEIAARMGLSIKTIECYYARLKSKLQLKKSTELLQRATLWVAGKRTEAGSAK